MSDSPPPFGEEEKIDQPSTVDIDLNDDKSPEEDTTEAEAAAESAAAAAVEPEAATKSETTKRQSANQPSDDLFFSTISDPEQHNDSKNNSTNNTSKTEDMDEIFRVNKPPSAAAAKTSIEDDDDPFSPTNPKNNDTAAAAAAAEATTPIVPVASPATVGVSQKQAEAATAAAVPEKMTDLTEALKKQSLTASHSLYSSLPEEDEEDKDKFLNIVLSDPHKVGDGMGAYMVYKITTTTNFPMFKSKEFTTTRRFSDFLALYEKLKEKHLPAGRILPPAPEKDMLGTAKVKMSKEDQGPGEFIGKRRAALERFLMRLAKHKSFRYDPDFRDFIEIGDDLPRASNTSALSGAGMLKMFKNVTDSVTKIAFKMEETDQWFEEKSRQVENLYVQYKKLHSMIDLLYGWRKDLAASVKDFSKSLAILANAEEQLALSRALSQLGEVYEKIDAIYLDQANSDYFTFGELVKDYVSLFDNVKEVFYQRIKTFGGWQKAEETLKTKKDAKAKLEAANKQDKIPAAAAEIKDWEGKVEKSKEEFEQISKTIKEEVKRFDLVRANEFRIELTKYVEKMYQNQENIVKLWEQYLPEIRAI